MASQERLDFGLIQQHVDRLNKATGNRLERQWPDGIPQHPGSQATVVAIYKNAQNIFAACRFLLADTPPNPARKPEYALAVPSMIRALLELLGTFVFLFESLAARTEHFYKGGWRDAYLDTERLRRERGADPSWGPTLAVRQADLDRMKLQFALTFDEIADPEHRIESWPRLHPMIRKLKGDRASYLQYLNDWFYRTLSVEAHPTWLGLGKALTVLGDGKDQGERRAELDMVRTKGATVSLAILLALITEVERELKFGEMGDIKYVWSILSSWDPDVKDFYEHVYEPHIGPAVVVTLPRPTDTA